MWQVNKNKSNEEQTLEQKKFEKNEALMQKYIICFTLKKIVKS